MLTFFFTKIFSFFFVIQLSELEQVEEECEENHTEVSEIDLLCIKLAAEKRADERDSVLAKQLRKLYKEFFLVDYLLNLL